MQKCDGCKALEKRIAELESRTMHLVPIGPMRPHEPDPARIKEIVNGIIRDKDDCA